MFGFFRKKQPETQQIPDYFNATGPDFSNVDSRAKAEEMAARGDLEKLLLLPVEFGGSDAANNVFVPVGLAAAKSGIDLNIITPLITDGKINRYSAPPKYQGTSFIPISIEIRAWDPGESKTTINIWGEALNGQPK